MVGHRSFHILFAHLSDFTKTQKSVSPCSTPFVFLRNQEPHKIRVTHAPFLLNFSASRRHSRKKKLKITRPLNTQDVIKDSFQIISEKMGHSHLFRLCSLHPAAPGTAFAALYHHRAEAHLPHPLPQHFPFQRPQSRALQLSLCHFFQLSHPMGFLFCFLKIPRSLTPCSGNSSWSTLLETILIRGISENNLYFSA